MKYKITTLNRDLYHCYWEVEASSKEEAIQKFHDGSSDVNYLGDDFIDTEDSKITDCCEN
jgi:galactose-1-phosphate uridylyltransferase